LTYCPQRNKKKYGKRCKEMKYATIAEERQRRSKLMENKTMVLVQRKEDNLKAILDMGKGEILKEFEKICPTDKSFQRMKKDMHDIFDLMEEKLQQK
jgi:hypothetical protein